MRSEAWLTNQRAERCARGTRGGVRAVAATWRYVVCVHATGLGSDDDPGSVALDRGRSCCITTEHTRGVHIQRRGYVVVLSPRKKLDLFCAVQVLKARHIQYLRYGLQAVRRVLAPRRERRLDQCARLAVAADEDVRRGDGAQEMRNRCFGVRQCNRRDDYACPEHADDDTEVCYMIYILVPEFVTDTLMNQHTHQTRPRSRQDQDMTPWLQPARSCQRCASPGPRRGTLDVGLLGAYPHRRTLLDQDYAHNSSRRAVEACANHPAEGR